jgi:hypothetical protein
MKYFYINFANKKRMNIYKIIILGNIMTNLINLLRIVNNNIDKMTKK